MAVAQPQTRFSPFDVVADHYDQDFTFSKIGQAQRSAVWRVMEQAFHLGDHVLEIGCGTGVDASFLADRGVRVLACDSSPAMIEVAARRLRNNGKIDLIRPHLLAAEDLSSLRPEQAFDGAFSNFGALNCVSDIGRLATDLARLLRPGATALLCWMGPCCLSEIAWYLGQGHVRKAFRRLHKRGVDARLADGGSLVHVQYPSVRTLARTFAPQFRLKSVHGIGVAVPPSYVEPWTHRFPGLFGLTVRADSLLGRVPAIRNLADHVLLRFEREAEPA